MNSTIINIINISEADKQKAKEDKLLKKLLEEQNQQREEEYDKWMNEQDFMYEMDRLKWMLNDIFFQMVDEAKYNTNNSIKGIKNYINEVEAFWSMDELDDWEKHQRKVSTFKRSKRRTHMKKDKAKHGLPKYYSKSIKAKEYMGGKKRHYAINNWMKIELSSL